MLLIEDGILKIWPFFVVNSFNFNIFFVKVRVIFNWYCLPMGSMGYDYVLAPIMVGACMVPRHFLVHRRMYEWLGLKTNGEQIITRCHFINEFWFSLSLSFLQQSIAFPVRSWFAPTHIMIVGNIKTRYMPHFTENYSDCQAQHRARSFPGEHKQNRYRTFWNFIYVFYSYCIDKLVRKVLYMLQRQCHVCYWPSNAGVQVPCCNGIAPIHGYLNVTWYCQHSPLK